MARFELRPYSEDFVGAAGELLAARHPRNIWVDPSGHAVARQDGRIVGAFRVVPAELSGVHSGLARTASGFRPARGFRQTFLRLSRHIP